MTQAIHTRKLRYKGLKPPVNLELNGRAKVYGAMTFFTVVARTSFTPRVKFLTEEVGNDALENNERGGTTDAIRDSSDQ
jgi:hypothetical protein